MAGGFFFSAKGMLTGGCLLIIPFILGGMGGGDVKLLAALGAWLGCAVILNIFLFGSVTGSFIALGLVFLKKRRLNLINVLNDMLFFALTKKRVALSENSENFPYSIPMATGFLIYILCYSFDFLIFDF